MTQRKLLWAPNTGPQTAFLSATAREVLYGGAAGGGKSDALVVAPLRWIDNPKHSAIILRRTRPELQEVIDRAKQLYPEVAGTRLDAIWSEQRSRFVFPSGARIRMGYAQYVDDIYNFKSDQYNWIGFDELTSFAKKQYLFMLSRNRTVDAMLPLQIRAATNPGGVGHGWVKERFFDGQEPYDVRTVQVQVPGYKNLTMTRQFIPATVFDNPKLENADEYIAGLQDMGPEMAAALLHGDWNVFEGQFFTELPEKVDATLADSEYYVIRCMDYGFVDNTAVYWLVAYRNLERVDVVAEVYTKGMTVDGIVNRINETEQILAQVHGVQTDVLTSVADPSLWSKLRSGERSLADWFMNRGVFWDRANNSRVSGWAVLRELIHTGKLKVWRGKAPALYRTLPALKYDDNNPDDIYTRHAEDHAADALRYGAMAYHESAGPPEQSEPLARPDVKDRVFDQVQDAIQRGQVRDPLFDVAY